MMLRSWSTFGEAADALACDSPAAEWVPLTKPHEQQARPKFACRKSSSSITDAPTTFTHCAAMPPFKDDQIIVRSHVSDVLLRACADVLDR
jgi:hypothetical protein